MERLTYTVSEVAQVLGLSRSKAYELVASGAIPAVAIPGRRKLVARVTVERLVDTAFIPDSQPDPSRYPNYQLPPRDPGPFTRPLPSPPPNLRHSTHTSAPGVPGRFRRTRER